MLAKRKAIKPKKPAIFIVKLIFEKSFFSKFFLNIKTIAYNIIAIPKIIDNEKSKGFNIFVKSGRI